MVEIKIDKDGCRKCGLCVKICPTEVLREEKDRSISVVKVQDCIECFSCCDVCPSDAISLIGMREVWRGDVDTSTVKMTKKII